VIGLVLVSHSAKLASGVAELAAQMAGPQVGIAIAGGLDQPGQPLGTDATLVRRAVEEVWSNDGVLVLMDLGSAVLSAELALELLPEERRSRVLLTEAPLVEGAVAAAVAAGLGDPLEQVAEAARGGLSAKTAHLATEPPPAAPTATAAVSADRTPGAPGPDADAAGPAPHLRLTVNNRLGLHARPAALVVRTAAGFDADVTIEKAGSGRDPVSARSLNAVGTLGVRRGDEIVVRASGPQAEEALAAIRRLADGGFGEAQDAAVPGVAPGEAASSAREPAAVAPPTAPPPPGAVLRGLSASPGVAIGPARRLTPSPPRVPDAPPGDPETEWRTLEHALAAAAADVRRSRASVAGRAGGPDAAIFDAHLLFLEDEALLAPAREQVRRHGVPAARAWADAVAAAAIGWDALDDPYQRARAADLRAVGDQVLGHLLGEKPGLDATSEAIVVAPDLTPAQTAALDPKTVRGIACAFGGPTAHSAILARSLGIPAVVGAGTGLLAVEDGTPLVLDGEAGTVTVDPPPGAVATARERRAAWAAGLAEAAVKACLPAVSRDGVDVFVAANIAGPQDVPAALAAGADGVGLLRTEFLFVDADHLPGEDEQERAYRETAEALGGRPLTIRTLDAGADKPLPYLPLPRERNPFLGVRGLRLGLSHPELLTGQLRAILRVAADHPVRILFPMVATVEEVRLAGALLEEARASLAADGIPAPDHLEVGVMIEVPAAALTAESLAPHVDFFSIGTNDLTQYTLAAERGNADVASLADPLHPAVIRLIERTARAAFRAGRQVAVCGEVAGDPVAIPLLLGLGIGELSMAPARIAAAKQAVRATVVDSARRLAESALDAGSAAAVRRLCGGAADEPPGGAGQAGPTAPSPPPAVPT